jgi:hypothetical protein
MSEQLGFALVLLVAIASLASILLLGGAEKTGYLTTETIECGHVRCPGHTPAYPLIDQQGRLLRSDSGEFICVCPSR